MNTANKPVVSKIRSTHRSWTTHSKFEPEFVNVVTIDPSAVEETWEKLSVNTQVVEFHEMPVRLHRALVKMLPSYCKELSEQ